jgi:hypothetical protein
LVGLVMTAASSGGSDATGCRAGPRLSRGCRHRLWLPGRADPFQSDNGRQGAGRCTGKSLSR